MAACENVHRTVQEKSDGSHAWVYCSEQQAHQEMVNVDIEVGAVTLGIILLIVALCVLYK